MKVYCDNKFAIAITHNPVLHDWTKHIEVDKHFIKEKLDSGLVCMPYIPINEHITDILTKKQFEKLVYKLAMKNIFRPAWGGVLKGWPNQIDLVFLIYLGVYFYVNIELLLPRN